MLDLVKERLLPHKVAHQWEKGVKSDMMSYVPSQSIKASFINVHVFHDASNLVALDAVVPVAVGLAIS